MIGNDIVDLAQARRESNWRRRGYLDKVFTLHEQQLIRTAPNPDQLVWLLWSMKESVYKLVVRRSQNRVFAPCKIACDFAGPVSDCTTGIAYYDGLYHTTSTITTHYISTIAFVAHEKPAYSHVILSFETTDFRTHHDLIRAKISQQAALLFDVTEPEIHLSKDNIGAPALSVRGNPERPISISHHGHFGAFAIGLR